MHTRQSDDASESRAAFSARARSRFDVAMTCIRSCFWSITTRQDGTTTPTLLNEFYSIESNVGSAEVGQAVFETGQPVIFNPNSTW